MGPQDEWNIHTQKNDHDLQIRYSSNTCIVQHHLILYLKITVISELKPIVMYTMLKEGEFNSTVELYCDVPQLQDTLYAYYHDDTSHTFIWTHFYNGTHTHVTPDPIWRVGETDAVIGQYSCQVKSIVGYTQHSDPVTIEHNLGK